MFTGGSLKLKGDDGKVKKKKKSKKSKEDSDLQPATTSPATRTKTAAELKFLEVKQKRLNEKVEKLAEKSHKERVNEFNTYLSKLSEHNDIPRVGPG
ncbi:hypothetical protein BC833DRAFT_591139 [Globomyces pollinis-pini]|nr:hypothetical protein BC833DRAFT_591139 [Globomyces pollinis-pini]KAJ2999130.1 hypothetical protein HDV02_003419 [Globomyces sp. JEL0801]